MLTRTDIKQLESHGLTIKQVASQLETFERGIPPVEVRTAATINNGIEKIPTDSQQELAAYYEKNKQKLDIVKFVPASGAATRMFKFLHQFVADFDPEEETFRQYVKAGNHKQVHIFFDSLKEFAFVNEVRRKIRKKYPDFKSNKKGVRNLLFVKTMLDAGGLNYGGKPKGLVPFHKYKKYSVTAFEEQLYEAAFYAVAEDHAFLHFTFSEKHVDAFKKEYEAIKNRVSKKTRVNFHISYSFQKNSTDTIAVAENNKPFRDPNDKLIFRPSGHGALLDNLNDIDADIVFIKNIDNVVCESYVERIAFFKRMLAGKLMKIQKQAFTYLRKLESEEMPVDLLKEIKTFLWNELNIKDIPEERLPLQYLLNRPIRVCGVVKNTGAPGGGPFWIKDEYGKTTLQIVELSQIDPSNTHQRNIIQEATHFNPVDIVCGLRDYQGNKFDLHRFADPKSGFITHKSQHGVTLKALELPGLWNGAMAKWNTALVEVPLETFNPVKTVNDLLEHEHRPNA